jgi:hypothetical protein
LQDGEQDSSIKSMQEVSTKTCSNNMVSLNDHVVMNHQNQTRTNGIWGHVRYTYLCTNHSIAVANVPMQWKVYYLDSLNTTNTNTDTFERIINE